MMQFAQLGVAFPSIYADTNPANNVAASDHFVQFYESDEQLVSEVASFAADALRDGGSAIVIARADRLAAVHERLDALGTAIGAAARDRIFMSSAQALLDSFMDGDLPDPARFRRSVGTIVEAAVRAGRPVHAFGEMVSLLCAQDRYVGALRLEALWDELIARYRFSLYCGYSHDAFPSAEQSEMFRHVCSLHRRILPAASLRNDENELHLTLALSQQRSRALSDEIRRREDAEQQRNGVDQVNNAVNEMDKITQANAATAEEASSAAQVLHNAAADLDVAVIELNEILGRDAQEIKALAEETAAEIGGQLGSDEFIAPAHPEAAIQVNASTDHSATRAKDLIQQISSACSMRFIRPSRKVWVWVWR